MAFPEAGKISDIFPLKKIEFDFPPAAAPQRFRWQHRRQAETDQSDYHVDASFGGPVPRVDGMMTGGHTRTARNSSRISATTLKLDLSS